MVGNSPEEKVFTTSEQTKVYKVRGIRGAISVPENTTEAIYTATQELLLRVFEENQVEKDDIASIFFTTTTDLNAGFPAAAARGLGLTDVALMCGHEMEVPGALRMILRVLLHVNTLKSAAELRHVYMGDAVNLRPDKAGKTEKI
jgi:chorismate mutase